MWKTELRGGRADPAFAARLGRLLALIHRTTAHDPTIAADFPTDAIFHSICAWSLIWRPRRFAIPILLPLYTVSSKSRQLRNTHSVHGDFSPKNILVGPQGPVLLDAECAWYQRPGFRSHAPCLNHLLLKCLWTPAASADFLRCFDALREAYLEGVAWEPVDVLEARAAALLPALFLARIDGKSPVEYLTVADQDRVRRVARSLIQTGPERLETIRQTWAKELANA